MIILDELAFAEDMNKKGFIKTFSIYELSIYAKWRRYLDSKKEDAEIEKELIEFSKKYNENFIYEVDYPKIDKALQSIENFRLRVPIPTYVTESEWDKIQSLDNIKHRKVMFVMLVVSKYYKHNDTRILKNGQKRNSKYDNVYFCNLSDANIIKLAGVRFRDTSDRNKMFNMLYSKGFIDVTRGKRCTRIVKIVNNNSNHIETVNDYHNIILYYDRLTGMNIGECEECGRLFRQNKNNTFKYCKEHRGYVPKGTKTITCIEPDCSKEVVVDAKDNETCRCEKHREEHIKESNRIRKQRQRQREKEKMSRSQLKS